MRGPCCVPAQRQAALTDADAPFDPADDAALDDLLDDLLDGLNARRIDAGAEPLTWADEPAEA